MLLVLHVEFDQGGFFRQPIGDALNQPQPVKPGQHEQGTRFLGDPGDVNAIDESVMTR